MLDERKWFYHTDGRQRVFEAGEEHPGKGWFETAAEAGLVPKVHPDRDTVLVPGGKATEPTVDDKARVVVEPVEPVEVTEPEGPVEIPADWQGLHWTKQVALAKRLGGTAETKDEAVAVIEAALLSRQAQ